MARIGIDVLNFPLKGIENEGRLLGGIRDSVINKIINTLPEHHTITALKTTLINALRTANSSINNTFLNIVDSNYVKMHQHLMAETNAFSSQAGYDYKSYQGDFLSQKAVLKARDITLKIALREQAFTDLGGLEKFPVGINLPNKEFTFPMLSVDRKTGVILEVTGYGPNADSSYKFEIANRANYFTGNEYLKNPNAGKFRTWRPLIGNKNFININKFVVEDILQLF